MHRRRFLQAVAAGWAGANFSAAQTAPAVSPADRELWRLGAADLAEAIRQKKVSSVEVVRAHLERIEKLNSRLNAVTVVLADESLKAAEKADAALARGEAAGPLHGVPFTVKENIDLLGSATTQGVAALRSNLPAADSPHVAQLKEAGGIPIGRTNLPDFGLRWHTDSRLRGATVNPWDPSRTPGGSSGGEAVALATGMTPLGLGNDYGGSLRWPSQCCGTAALKPTTGRIAQGLAAPSGPTLTIQLFAVQGPMARHVRDLKLALANMIGFDPADPQWTSAPLRGPSGPRKVALSLEPGGQPLHPDVESGVRKAARALSERGYVVEEAEPPAVAEAKALWARLVGAEIQMTALPEIGPLLSEDSATLLNLFLQAWPAADYAGYMSAWRERHTVARRWSEFQREYPIVLGPVCTNPPFRVGFDVAGKDEVASLVDSMCLVLSVNLLGLPSAALPVGTAGGIPQGVQLIGPRFREDLCLETAQAIEEELGTPTPIEPVFLG